MVWSWKKVRKDALFYDANCFSTISVEDLKLSIDFFDNFLISSVKHEIFMGKSMQADIPGYHLVLTPKGELTKSFNEISLEYCDKKNHFDHQSRQFLLKEYPLFCSAYYTWLVSAVNPAIIHDSLRHAYNELLYQLKNNPKEMKEIYNIESKLRVKETQHDNNYLLDEGRNPTIRPHWILKSRRKRMDDIKDGQFKLTDYQTLTTSLLYSCISGRCTSILTSDRDFLDIRDNLYQSIIERYATYQILTEKVANFNHAEKQEFLIGSIDIDLTIEDINKYVLKTLNKISKDKKYIMLNILIYRSDVNKIFTYETKIPIWLRNFILEFKKNLDCYSLDPSYESKYNIKYLFHPNFETGLVKYRVFTRKSPEIKVCWSKCEKQCKYAIQELNNPAGLSEFIPSF